VQGPEDFLHLTAKEADIKEEDEAGNEQLIKKKPVCLGGGRSYEPGSWVTKRKTFGTKGGRGG